MDNRPDFLKDDEEFERDMKKIERWERRARIMSRVVDVFAVIVATLIVVSFVKFIFDAMQSVQ